MQSSTIEVYNLINLIFEINVYFVLYSVLDCIYL